MTAPLAEGWTYFRSQGSLALGGSEPHWYATAPYHMPSLPAVDGRGKLDQTVSAPTWAELHRLVTAQMDKYHKLTSCVLTRTRGRRTRGHRRGGGRSTGERRTSRLASSSFRGVPTSIRARIRARTAATRGSSRRQGKPVGKPQITRPSDMRGDREWFPGTLEDDVIIVHRISVTPKATRCGAYTPHDEGTTRVYGWQRAVNCPGCLAADWFTARPPGRSGP